MALIIITIYTKFNQSYVIYMHLSSNLAPDYTLSGHIGKVVASHAAVARSIPLRCTDLYYARGAQGVLPMRVLGAPSQLDLPSVTPLSVAGCG